uniref:F-actin-uncapping protein LRRC16A isoform X1 n=1 Tax=Petromyzon marinus TaxID=7757 RepID=A0AAJ7TZV8_PETMA|nr:F-actin-uncapping protein LRRC16A isoform X1 [Petromyzon marinus]
MADEATDIPPELADSVKEVMGRVKIGLKRRVKLELRADRVEHRVLILTACRTFLLTARVPSKVETSFHFLDIESLTSVKPCQLLIDTDRQSFPFKLASQEETDQIVGYVGCSLKKLFPGASPMRLMQRVVVEPQERLARLQAVWESHLPPEPGPCGGFSQMYACLCDYYNLPYREEVQWDVDTIYLSQDTHELNLQDFSHLDNRDLVPIVAVLEFNQWFTKLLAQDLKLGSEVSEQVLRAVARSTQLQELLLENAGLKTDFAQKLGVALAQNGGTALHSISLAGNALEDRGAACLSGALGKLGKGLALLNLSRTALTAKGVNTLAQALSSAPVTASTLTHLDLSGNALRGDDLTHLHSFLAVPNALEHLDLSATDCAVDSLFGPFLRGCCHHLAHINLSRNVFSQRRTRDIAPSCKQFFCSSLALRHLGLSGTKLPAEAVKALLLGLTCNQHARDVSLDISSTELGHCLRSAGAQVLEGCIADVHNISSLDVSDNGLESDLATLTVWLCKNRSIKHLALGRNFSNMKPKNVAPVLDNIVQMIQDEDSPLQSLSLADSKLKADLTIVINALGSNTSLTRVDLSGNSMGDIGAKMLAKALQINTKLRTVIWDKNNTTAQGFQDVAGALEKNYTLRYMPTPVNDASVALKANPEKTEEALQKIENVLLRNHESRRFSPEQAYRLQQGIVTSTSQQMVDRMCVKVRDHLNSLRNVQAESVRDDVRTAESLVRDAKNARTLLPNLYHVGAEAWYGESGARGSPIQAKLELMAGEITVVVEKQLETLLDSMLDAAQALCPHVMRPGGEMREELRASSAGKVSVPQDFVRKVLLTQAAADILNKISEVKLATASHLSDRLMDEILGSLSTSQHRLGEHVHRSGRPVPRAQRRDSEELDAPEEGTRERRGDERERRGDERERRGDEAAGTHDAERHEDADSCTTLCCPSLTPKSKRKSIYSRKLRPVSKLFEFEIDPVAMTSTTETTLTPTPTSLLDEAATPESPGGGGGGSGTDRSPHAALAELPSEECRKLEHVTKGRPRRAKKQPLGRLASCTGGIAESQEGEQNGIMGRVDEGVDEFFSKKVSRVSSKRGSLRRAESTDADASERRRDSKKGSFFGFMRPRGSYKASPSPGPTAGAAAPGPAAEPAAEAPRTEAPRTEVKAAEMEAPAIAAKPDEEERSPHPFAEDTVRSVEPARAGGAAIEPGKVAAVAEPSKPSPPGARRVPPGYPVMGGSLLAEMKAKQERRAIIQQRNQKSAEAEGLGLGVAVPRDAAAKVAPLCPAGPTSPRGPLSPSPPSKPSPLGKPAFSPRPKPSWTSEESGDSVSLGQGRSPSESSATPGHSSRSATPEGELSGDDLRTDTDNELEQMSQRNNNLTNPAHEQLSPLPGTHEKRGAPGPGAELALSSGGGGGAHRSHSESGGGDGDELAAASRARKKVVQRRKASQDGSGGGTPHGAMMGTGAGGGPTHRDKSSDSTDEG